MAEEYSPLIGPDFVVAGVARCGTSSLADWLGQHPEIHMSPVKETNFFSRPDLQTNGPGDEDLNRQPVVLPDGKFAREHVAGIFSWEEYERCLQPSDESQILRGEASVSYSFYPEAARRLHDANPDCRIIFVLREPVARAYSNYLFFKKFGRESLNFADALAQESQRQKQGYEFAWAYAGLSHYRRAIANLLRHFPAEQIHCAQFETLIAGRDRESWEELLLFLGVDSEFVPERTHLNPTQMQTDVPVEETVTQRLRYELREEIEFYETLFNSTQNSADVLRKIEPLEVTQARRDWRTRLRGE